MDIRPATAADRLAIERIVHDAYAVYIARIGKPPGPMLDDYAARIADRMVWVAADDVSLAGVIVLVPAPDHLLLDNVAVAQAQQGKGIGRRLLDFADAEARRRALPELRLYTHALMHENQALYRRLGWREYGRGEEAGYARVFMRKTA